MATQPDFVYKRVRPKKHVPPAPLSSEDEDESENDSDEAAEIEDLESQLDDLCNYAELEYQNQPLPTQVWLSEQSKTLFHHYELQGTAVALKGGLERFFNIGSNAPVRYQGRDVAFAEPLPIDYEPPPPDPEDSRMVDEESRDLVRNLPFRIERLLSFRPNVMLDPVVMQAYNNIFVLYNAHANMMLRHHFAKWGEEAIFRLGVQSLFQR